MTDLFFDPFDHHSLRFLVLRAHLHLRQVDGSRYQIDNSRLTLLPAVPILVGKFEDEALRVVELLPRLHPIPLDLVGPQPVQFHQLFVSLIEWIQLFN